MLQIWHAYGLLLVDSVQTRTLADLALQGVNLLWQIAGGVLGGDVGPADDDTDRAVFGAGDELHGGGNNVLQHPIRVILSLQGTGEPAELLGQWLPSLRCALILR